MDLGNMMEYGEGKGRCIVLYGLYTCMLQSCLPDKKICPVCFRLRQHLQPHLMVESASLRASREWIRSLQKFLERQSGGWVAQLLILDLQQIARPSEAAKAGSKTPEPYSTVLYGTVDQQCFQESGQLTEFHAVTSVTNAILSKALAFASWISTKASWSSGPC